MSAGSPSWPASHCSTARPAPCRPPTQGGLCFTSSSIITASLIPRPWWSSLPNIEGLKVRFSHWRESGVLSGPLTCEKASHLPWLKCSHFSCSSRLTLEWYAAYFRLLCLMITWNRHILWYDMSKRKWRTSTCWLGLWPLSHDNLVTSSTIPQHALQCGYF